MDTLFILLRSSYDDGSWIVKIIVGVVAALIVSAIRSGKKKIKSTDNVSALKPSKKNSKPAIEVPEPTIPNDSLDKILENQEKLNKISKNKEESIWEEEK